jgi:hypothetical protein
VVLILFVYSNTFLYRLRDERWIQLIPQRLLNDNTSNLGKRSVVEEQKKIAEQKLGNTAVSSLSISELSDSIFMDRVPKDNIGDGLGQGCLAVTDGVDKGAIQSVDIMEAISSAPLTIEISNAADTAFDASFLNDDCGESLRAFLISCGLLNEDGVPIEDAPEEL